MRWAVIAVVTGCFSPQPPEGAPCGPNRECPAGQMCSVLDDRCYRDPSGDRDATGGDGKDVDGQPTTCTPKRLLTGGMDLAQQGWQVLRTGSGSITSSAGVTTLTTTNNSIQLIVLRDAFAPTDRWMIQIVGQVVTSGGHTKDHAAIALMPSFHDPVGDDNDRRRMLALGEKTFAWGEGGATISGDLTQQVVYRLERTTTSNGGAGIRASIIPPSGMTTMNASPFTSNGTIAIGDQTTNAGLDSSFRLITVDLLCP